MSAARTAAVHRDPKVWPIVAAVCVAAVLWAISLENHGYAIRYPAVPIAFATFLAVQLLVPRVRWNGRHVLGPGNIATLLFCLQLVVIPTLMVLSGPYLGTLRFIPANQYVNTALLLQTAAYPCYAVGYIASSKPTRPQRFLLEPRVTTGVACCFIVLGAAGLAVAFPSIGSLVDYFSGQASTVADTGPTSTIAAAAQLMRPFLAYGVIVLWAARIARRRPGARLQPLEAGLVVLAIGASATYDYNRASAVIPLLAIITAYSRFGRRQSPVRIMTFLALIATLGFLFGAYREVYQGTQGGAISQSDAKLDQPRATFTDNLQSYGNGPQLWSVVVQDVDRNGMRDGNSVISSALYPVPVLGKSYRSSSGPIAYNTLFYGEADIIDQILGFGAELYWSFGITGITVGYFALGFAIRRFDDRVETAPDPLVAYSWSYCGTWVAMLIINSISILSQIVVYFFWPVFTMSAIAYLARSQRFSRSRSPDWSQPAPAGRR